MDPITAQILFAVLEGLKLTNTTVDLLSKGEATPEQLAANIAAMHANYDTASKLFEAVNPPLTPQAPQN